MYHCQSYESKSSHTADSQFQPDCMSEPRRPWLADGCSFSEFFLQILWNEQHLLHSMVCEDGTLLQVIHQGIWNTAGGPDFTQASLLFNGHLVRGDVEVHQKTTDWQRHGHSDNSAYDAVILHVVWQHDGTPSGAPQRVLVLQKNVTSSWKQLIHRVEDACYPRAQQFPQGKCAMRWALTETTQIQEVLSAAGLTRFEAKAASFSRCSISQEPDQAFYERMFEGLGYKQNREAFKELAAALPLSMLMTLPSLDALQAVLFGAAGLLPDPSQSQILPVWKPYILRWWTHWWNAGSPSVPLHWNHAETRPLNHPCRRLAAGASWLWMTHFHPLEWLSSLALNAASPDVLLKSFFKLSLDITPWNHCQDFFTAVSPPAALMGRQRLLDVIINLFLPVLAAHPLATSHPAFAPFAADAFLRVQKSQGNRLLKEASLRLLMPPSRSHEILRKACHQQGLLYIYSRFCLSLSHDCSQCPFNLQQ